MRFDLVKASFVGILFGAALLLWAFGSGCTITWVKGVGTVVEEAHQYTFDEIRADASKLVFCYQTTMGVQVFSHDGAPCPLKEATETAIESIAKDTGYDVPFMDVDGWTLIYTPYRFNAGKKLKWASGMTDVKEKTIVVNYGSWVRTTRHEFFHVIVTREGTNDGDHGSRRWCVLKLFDEETHKERCPGIKYY